MDHPEDRGGMPPWKWMWANLFHEKGPDQVTIRDSLERIPLFRGLSRKELRRIEQSLYLRRYRAEEFIFRKGEPGLGMYIVHKGSVSIQHSQAADRGILASMLDLGPGDFFGEMALLDEHVHIVSAKARTYTELLGFFRPDFMSILHYHPRLGSKLLLALGRVIASRFRASLEAMEYRET